MLVQGIGFLVWVGVVSRDRTAANGKIRYANHSELIDHDGWFQFRRKSGTPRGVGPGTTGDGWTKGSRINLR